MPNTTPLEKIKLSMRITTDMFDQELTDLISSALLDLGIAGVDGALVATTDPLVLRAVTTYCKMHFGEPDEYDRLKKSYDEQKAQMGTATGYTTWTAPEA
jgi:hypothetical protein